MRPMFCLNWSGAASGPTWSPTRPAPTTWSTATCRRAGPSRSGRTSASPTPPPSSAAATASIVDHVQAMLDFQRAGRPDHSTTATTSARSPSTRAWRNAFDFPGFVPAYIRPLFCRGIGPFRWAALSGDPEDIRKTDAAMKKLFPDNAAPAPLARHGGRADRLPGPARAHLLDRPRRPPPRGPDVQRDGGLGRARRPPSSSAATTSTPARSPAPTARRKR